MYKLTYKPLSPVYICGDSKYCPPPPVPYRRPLPYKSRLPRPPVPGSSSQGDAPRKKYSFRVLTPEAKPETEQEFGTIFRKDLRPGSPNRCDLRELGEKWKK